MATRGERCDCYMDSEKDRQFSFSSSPKICCDTKIAYCVRNRRPVGVDYVHSSWQQEERDANVYTNPEKVGQISISSSTKICSDTMIAYCVRNRCTDSVDFEHSTWRLDERDAIAIWIQKRIDRSHSHPLQHCVAIQGSHIV